VFGVVTGASMISRAELASSEALHRPLCPSATAEPVR
jgi:hypothetical protein